MESFDSILRRKIYEKVNKRGDRLAKIESAIDCGVFSRETAIFKCQKCRFWMTPIL